MSVADRPQGLVREDADRIHDELEAVYCIAARGRLRDIEAALALFPPAGRLRNSRALALRAMCGVLSGDVPGGVGLLQRAVAQSDARTRPYMIDLLVPLLISSSRMGEAEALLEDVGAPSRALQPALTALRAVVCACRGDDDTSRRFAAQAIVLSGEIDQDLIRARVLQRSSLAAFTDVTWSKRKNEVLEAARVYESLGSFRNAAIAYSVLYSIAHVCFGDASLAQSYAKRVVMNGQRAADASWERFGNVAQMEVAAESGDRRRLGAARARLAARPLHQQYSERFSIVLASALAHGWSGRFDTAQTMVSSLGGSDRITRPMQAMCDALLALFAAAAWNLDETRRLARVAIGRTVRPVTYESLNETHMRRMARIVAAASCAIIGDVVRSRRALSRKFDPDESLIRLITPAGIDEDRAPELFRGYARLINVVARAATANRPSYALTSAELAVLRMLPHGMTLAAMAEELGKSRETVKKQTKSVYAKLGAVNRTQAIRRAREAGIVK